MRTPIVRIRNGDHLAGRMKTPQPSRVKLKLARRQPASSMKSTTDASCRKSPSAFDATEFNESGIIRSERLLSFPPRPLLRFSAPHPPHGAPSSLPLKPALQGHPWKPELLAYPMSGRAHSSMPSPARDRRRARIIHSARSNRTRGSSVFPTSGWAGSRNTSSPRR